jgi:DNA-binding GntR family transcriptional regulator
VPRPKYTIAASIRELIRDGTLKPGDLLVGLPELCADYGCAPGTMRAALALLEAEGLVLTVQGRGTVIRVPGTIAGSRQLAIDVLRGRIASGELVPGSKVPSHTAMAAEFGISEATAKLVVRDLREAGVVESRVGVGVFVLPTDCYSSYIA